MGVKAVLKELISAKEEAQNNYRDYLIDNLNYKVGKQRRLRAKLMLATEELETFIEEHIKEKEDIVQAIKDSCKIAYEAGQQEVIQKMGIGS